MAETTQDLRALLKVEYAKCAKDPVYFMRKYVKIQHPVRGTIPFLTYKFQDEAVANFGVHRKNIVLKSRQMGITTLVAAYSLWLMIFHNDKEILCLSITQDTAKAIVTKVRFANDNLPSWLKVKEVTDNQLSLRLENGSQIKAASSAGTSGRSSALSLLIIDEAGFVPGVEDIWLSAQNTLSCLQKNSLVLTDHGLIRIGDLARPNMNIGFNDFSINVHDGNNIMPSMQFYCSPKSQLYKVKFKSGGFIVGTENHPLKTQLGWKSISGLEPTNHSVLVKYNQNLFGSEIDYSEFHKNLISVSRSDMKIVQLSNSDWAYLSGIWCAEGHFCERGIGITNTDIQIIDRLKSIGFNKIDDRHNMLHSKYAKETLMWIGCSGVAHTKRVPAKILSASRNEQIEFLRGLFDGDGCAMRSQGLKLTSVSSQLLSDVRAMLLNFGINSITRSVTWKSTKSTVIEDKSKIFHGFELTITGFDAHKFYSEIGFFLTRKQDHHKFLSKKPIKRVFPDKESVFRLIKKSGYSVAEFQKQHAVYVSRYLWVGGKGLSISTVLKMLEVCDKELPEYAELQNQYNKDISEYYDQVVSIEPTDIDLSYDIKVPGSESFISNGYVNHNTGGKAIVLSCVTADTYVFDKHIGLTQISNYIDNTKIGPYEISNYSVLGKDTFRSGTLFHNNGCVDTRKISTKFSDVECSLNHKLWAYKASTKTFGWTQSKDLEVGDFLSIQYGTQQFVGNDDISSFLPTVSEKIKYPFAPTVLTPDICYLLGLYIAEGSAHKVKNADGKLVGGTLTISCGDDISSVFDRLGLKYYTNDELHYCISNKNIIEFLEYIGFDLSRVAHEKIIPQRLMSISRDNMVQLLRGIFDGDGHGEAGTRVGLTSTSEILTDQVRMILLNFGILSSKFYTSKEQMNSYGGKIQHNYDTHSLEIYGQNALKYFTRVGFNVKRKQSGYDKLIKSNLSRSCPHDIIPNTLDLVNSLYTASGETSRTIGQKLGIQVNGYVSKKTKYKTPNISAANVKLLYSTYKHLLPTSDIEYWDTVIDDNLSWVQIKEIIESKNQTYDFSLPDNPSDNWCHSVLYNGILGHQTPNGVGNLFHKMWSEATDGLNDFNMINLPWQLHPERDQKWRDEQTKLLGPKGAAQECDCVFETSGNTVMDLKLIEWYEKESGYIVEPKEKRGHDRGYWIWEYPKAGRSYMVTADVARGDAADFSACQIIDIETLEQVGEYKGQLPTKEYARVLAAISTEYNMALLVVENANIGWAVIQELVDMDYKNLFYSSADLLYVDVEAQMTNKIGAQDKKLVPGFTTSSKSRPLLISKLESYIREKSLIIHSKRLIEELKVFVWKNSGTVIRAEAMSGYNDDLVMSMGIGAWVRDTALRLRSQSDELTRTILTAMAGKPKPTENKIHSTVNGNPYGINADPWKMRVNDDVSEDLTWLLR